jgi:2-oxo-4-hydroxy-4-carboxy-5-ureidoimidazoline decarboxylase
MTLAELNRMNSQGAVDVLKPCCGSQKWAEEMNARRPFSDIEEVHGAADIVWRTLHREDWHEAFASHPKVGETREVSEWSKKEQGGMVSAADDIRARLGQFNTEYQKRFGFIFIICATGKSAEEMLASLEERLRHDPDTEWEIAGEEQIKIVHLRLNKLLDA